MRRAHSSIGYARQAPPAPRTVCAPAGPARRGAFTLIELLASFTILAIIVSTLAVALHALSEIWQQAQTRTRVLVQARTVMDLIAQDLRQALPGTNAPITLLDAPGSYNATNHAVEFLRLLPPAASTNSYALAAIRYAVTNHTLLYWHERLTGDPTHTLSLFQQAPVKLTDGVATLQFLPPTAPTNAPDDALSGPSYLDVYLELLPPEEIPIADALSGSNQVRFIEQRVLRFAQRVFLPAANRGSLP
jgi:type II secretory pathway component PulJ